MRNSFPNLQQTFALYVTETLDEVNQAQSYLESLSTIDTACDTLLTMLNVLEQKLMSLNATNADQGRRVCERIGALAMSISMMDNSIGKSFLRNAVSLDGSTFNSCMAYAGKDFLRLADNFKDCRNNQI